MTSQIFSTDDGLLATSRKRSLVVRVDEVQVISPQTEELPLETIAAMTAQFNNQETERIKPDTSILSIAAEQVRPQSIVQWKTRPTQSISNQPPVSLPLHRGRVFPSTRSFSNNRKPNMQLPSFKSLGISSSLPKSAIQSDTIPPIQRSAHSDHEEDHSKRPRSDPHPLSRTWPLQLDGSSAIGALLGPQRIVPPLTPPEDVDGMKWTAQTQLDSFSGIQSRPSISENSTSSNDRSQVSQTANVRPSIIQLPTNVSINSEGRNEPLWLERACGYLVDHLADSGSPQQIQMIVQCLPMQSKSDEQKPVFEKIVENIQIQMSSAPYITITHAVSQVCTMEEVPASPPATPSTTHTSDDYFDDATIFTHAAVVPTYHIRPQQLSVSAPRPTNLIAAPSSVQVTTLERYIPPTSSMEVKDFFHLSRRSYLADRLMELSAVNGSLLLIYPTKTGASAFAKQYLGPIMEPFLRQFMMLNNLYVDVANSLSRMEALSSIPDFETMRGLVQDMCEAIGQRFTTRGLPSKYQIVCAETAEVTLDRGAWVEWFIEQEQGRLRQDLVDYHKSGGRMPIRSIHIEVTPSTLVREVVDGIRQSREPAGDVGIEVGVFVIRRHLL